MCFAKFAFHNFAIARFISCTATYKILLYVDHRLLTLVVISGLSHKLENIPDVEQNYRGVFMISD